VATVLGQHPFVSVSMVQAMEGTSVADHVTVAPRSERRPRQLSRRACLRLFSGGLAFASLSLAGACAPAAPQPAAPTAAPAPPTAPAKPAESKLAESKPAEAAKPAAPATSAPAAQPTAAGAAKPGGKTLIMGMWQEMPILNTLMTAEGGNVVSGTKLTLRGLLFTDEKGSFEGELAEQVPSTQNGGISADGKSVTYKLRRNVTWHDGKPVTSADVLYTWEAVMKPDNKVGTRYGYENISAVDTPDEQTAIVRFKEPFASWAILFDVVLPKHVLGQESDFNGSRFHQQPIGFGPFKVTENIKGDHVTYEAFDGYWRGRPKIDRMFIRYFGSADAMVQALKAKEVDLTWGTPLPSIPELKGLESQGITTLVQPGTGAERYVFNGDHQQVPLFGDKDLRMALALAVDRKTIVDKLLFGLTTIARGDWDNTPWENTALKLVEYQPDEAKQILDRLGWKPGSDGIRVKDGQRLAFVHTTTSGSQLRENVQLLVQQNFKDIGAEMTIKNERSSELFGSYAAGGGWARGNYQMGGWSQGISLPDPDISARYLTKEIPSDANPAGASQYRYSNPQIDTLFGQAAAELDPEKRKAIFFKIQEVMREEYAFIWLYNSTASWGMQSRVKNFDQTVKTPFGGFHWRAEAWDLA
jgi:peptide/nickel transport system substrate-binding protein